MAQEKKSHGRNLPVKEFCYLRTLFTDSRRVIGTADTLSVEERVLRERETVTTMCPRVPSSRNTLGLVVTCFLSPGNDNSLLLRVNSPSHGIFSN
jgi:hypothetical protein